MVGGVFVERCIADNSSALMYNELNTYIVHTYIHTRYKLVPSVTQEI